MITGAIQYLNRLREAFMKEIQNSPDHGPVKK